MNNSLADDFTLKSRTIEHCVICGSQSKVIREGMTDRLADAPGIWSHRQCVSPECRLVWLDPMPDADDIGILYRGYGINKSGLTYQRRTQMSRIWNAVAESVERKQLGGTAQAGLCNGNLEKITQFVANFFPEFQIVKRTFGERVHWVEKALDTRKLLDVGCGGGGLMQRLIHQGWDVTGIEPDPSAADQARRLGLKVIDGTVETALTQSDQFEAVTMQHVLEHLPNPLATLKSISSHMATAGRLHITTPNHRSLCQSLLKDRWLGWDAPRHLYIFDARSVKKIVEAAGFRIVDFWTCPRMSSWLVKISPNPREFTGPQARKPTAFVSCCSGAVRCVEEVTSRLINNGEELVIVAEKR